MNIPIISSKKNTFYNLFILILISIYLLYLIPANVDLSSGAYYLFMDEQISYDEIYKIIHSKNFIDLLRNVVGGDQRYGRIIYYITAIFCFTPAKLFGVTGQIISTRMFFAFALILSYYILSKTFIKNKIISLFLFICLMCIPTTSYFSTLPKPEPFLLLFLSLFLFFHIKNKGLFGIHFIFLGLSFGSKISIFFSIILIFSLSFLTEKMSNKNLMSNYVAKNFIYSILFFLLGFFIAVPIIPISLFKHSLFKLYLYSTFLGSAHGSDDLTINIFVWIKEILTNWLNAPMFLSVAIFCLSFFLIGKNVMKVKFDFVKKSSIQISILLILSISLTLPILFLVKRVWFFYLHVGVVFYMILLFFSIEKEMSRNRKFCFYSLFFVLFYSIYYMYYDQVKYLKIQANRSKSQETILQQKRFDFVLNTLNIASINQKKTTIFYSPHFYRLENSKFDIVEVWNYFDSWQEGRDYVFLSNANNPKISKPLNTNAQFKSWKKSVLNYDKFVNQNGVIPSYIEIASGIDGLYVFKRIR